MNFAEFKKIIKNNEINSTYLLIGEEEYLLEESIELLKKTYIDDSFEALNYTVLDGRVATIDDLINTCETLPFMSSKKMVVLKDVDQFIDKGDLLKDIYTYLDDLGNHVCLLMVDNSNELKKTTKLYKYYNKNNNVVEFTKLKGKDLSQWVERIIKENNSKMSFSNINYFIQHSSYLSRNVNSTLYDLENELKKVISYAKGMEVQKEDIDFVMVKSLDNNIFDLLASINKSDIDSSLSIFNEIYLSNEPIPKILFMISRQIRLMLGYNIYRDKGYTDGEIIDKLMIKSYEYSKISSQAKMYSIKTLQDYLNLILEVDKKLKTTSTDNKVEMEILIINLSRKVK